MPLFRRSVPSTDARQAEPGARPAARRTAARTRPGVRRAAVIVAALASALVAPTAADAALANRTFANTFVQTLHGDIAAIGNANSTCSPSWTPTAPATTVCERNTVPATTNNSGKGFGVLVDVDGDASTTNSSSSTVALPAGATVAYARLTWGSTGDNVDNNGEATVKLDTPAEAGIAYQGVTADFATRCGGYSFSGGYLLELLIGDRTE